MMWIGIIIGVMGTLLGKVIFGFLRSASEYDDEVAELYEREVQTADVKRERPDPPTGEVKYNQYL